MSVRTYREMAEAMSAALTDAERMALSLFDQGYDVDVESEVARLERMTPAEQCDYVNEIRNYWRQRAGDFYG